MGRFKIDDIRLFYETTFDSCTSSKPAPVGRDDLIPPHSPACYKRYVLS